MEKSFTIKEILNNIKELGTLELYTLESEIIKEFERRKKIK